MKRTFVDRSIAEQDGKSYNLGLGTRFMLNQNIFLPIKRPPLSLGAMERTTKRFPTKKALIATGCKGSIIPKVKMKKRRST